MGARFENAVRSTQDAMRPSRSDKKALLHTNAGDETGTASMTAIDLHDAPRNSENFGPARFSGLGRVSIVRETSLVFPLLRATQRCADPLRVTSANRLRKNAVRISGRCHASLAVSSARGEDRSVAPPRENTRSRCKPGTSVVRSARGLRLGLAPFGNRFADDLGNGLQHGGGNCQVGVQAGR